MTGRGESSLSSPSRVEVIAEIGINHNGDLRLATALIDAAKWAGCDAVKFQKRTPMLCVPPTVQAEPRDTPWGRVTYLEYRQRLEFERTEYHAIDFHCRRVGLEWFASCWDIVAAEFFHRNFALRRYKIPSAMLTNAELLRYVRSLGKPVLLSTGMSTSEEIHCAVNELNDVPLVLMHCTSAYPCPVDQINLHVIPQLAAQFPNALVGYSGHEEGIVPSLGAVTLGARVIERHLTLDQTMWGTDHAASLTPAEMRALVDGVRELELALGDGHKRVYDSELPALRRLRPIQPATINGD